MAKVDDLLNYSGRWAEYEVSRVVATNNKSETQRIQLQGWASDWLIHKMYSFNHPCTLCYTPKFCCSKLSCHRFRLVIFPYKKTLAFLFPASQATDKKNWAIARLKNKTKTLFLQANALSNQDVWTKISGLDPGGWPSTNPAHSYGPSKAKQE